MKVFSSYFSFTPRKVARFLSVALCVCLCLTLVMTANMSVAFCATPGIDAIEDIVTYGANEIYNIMRAIVIPVVIVFIAYAGLMFLVGGSRGTETARKVCFGCFFAVIFVAFAPIIGNQLGTWFKDFGGDGLDNYNPLD